MGRKSKGKGSDESVARERMAEVQANPAEHIGSEFSVDELLTEEPATAPTVVCVVHEPDPFGQKCMHCGLPLKVTMNPKTVDGLAAIREWEAEHGPLTQEDIDDARRLALDLRGAEAEARQSEKRFKDDGPVYTDHATKLRRDEQAAKTYPLSVVVDEFVNAGLCVVGVETLWYERAETMAKEKGLTMTQFINGLIRGAWVARPLSKRGA